MVALAAGKTYLTAGGYVVEIINDELHSSERTAPGVTAGINSRTCLEINKDPTNSYKDGWYYEPNGTVQGLTEEWTEKLRIVEELPFPIPKLPEGYEWADGYPQFREIKKGEYYISNHFHTYPKHYNNKDVHIIEYGHHIPSKTFSFERKRFAVVKAGVIPTPEPTKNTNPLIAKYGEPEAGWRWLADDEEVKEGDEYKSPSLGCFVQSENWKKINNKQQGLGLKPYRRKIEITQDKEYVEMHNYVDFPRYYKHSENGFVDNIKYIKRNGETTRQIINKDGSLEDKGYTWCRNCDYYVKKGIWIEVSESEVKDFISWACVQTPTIKFPIYYQHKTGFTGETKYVKKISENQYTVILKNTGKEAENEEYKWDKCRDESVTNGTWIEVPAAEVESFMASFKKPEGAKKEVNDFIASVTVTEANPTLVNKKEIEMKKETLVKVASGTARFAGNWGFRAANYWLFEPAINIAKPIMKGVRYITFVGLLCAAGYGYNYPEVVKNAIKSCIPKITIEAPEVLKG